MAFQLDWMVVIQATVLLLGLALFMGAQSLAQAMWGPSRARGRAKRQSGHHFVKGVQLLARSRTASSPSSSGSKSTASSPSSSGSKSKSLSLSLAKQASQEADLALALTPHDGAVHVLKALALEQQGLFQAALRCMNAALSPPVLDSLSPAEKADAFAKRAGVLLALSKNRRTLDAPMEDLRRSLSFKPDDPRALCLMALCLERRGSADEALAFYEKALAIDSSSDDARNGLQRLRP